MATLPSAEPPTPDWLPTGNAARRLTIEAAGRLLHARALIALRPLSTWRHRLGTPVPTPPISADASPQARYLSRVVERAAGYLPLEMKCLPRAMALHAMLARRGIPGTLTFAVLPGTGRGAIGDLHAWVQSNGEVVIGASELPYCPVVSFASAV